MRVHQRHFLDRGIPYVEQHRRPARPIERLGELARAAATEIGSGSGGRGKLRALNFRLLDDPLDMIAALQRIEQPSIRADIMVLQVHQLDAGIVPPAALAVHIGLDHVALGHPIQLLHQQTRITIEGVEDRLPTVQHILSRRVKTIRRIKARGRIEIGTLNRHRRRRASAHQLERFLHIQIAGHLFEHANRFVQLHRRQLGSRLKKFQHDIQGAHLQIGGDLRHIGIAYNDMETPKLRMLGMRLIARIDDRPLDHRIEIEQAFEKIGALRNLIFRRSGLIFRTDLAGPGENRPGDQEWDQHAGDGFERHGARH